MPEQHASQISAYLIRFLLRLVLCLLLLLSGACAHVQLAHCQALPHVLRGFRKVHISFTVVPAGGKTAMLRHKTLRKQLPCWVCSLLLARPSLCLACYSNLQTNINSLQRRCTSCSSASSTASSSPATSSSTTRGHTGELANTGSNHLLNALALQLAQELLNPLGVSLNGDCRRTKGQVTCSRCPVQLAGKDKMLHTTQ